MLPHGNWLERIAVAIAAVVLAALIWLGCTSVFQNDDFLQVLAMRLESDPATFQQLSGSTPASAGGAAGYLTSPHIYWANYYRPATRLLQGALWNVFGMNPLPFHIVNLLFHLLSIVLVARLAWELNFGPAISFWSAVIFAIHPVHGEPVVWIGGMGGLAAAVFFLVGLIMLAKFARSGNLLMLVGAALSSAVALLFKEEAAALPLAAAVVLWRVRRSDRTAVGALVLLSALVVGWFAWRSHVGASVSPAALQLSGNPLTWMRNGIFYLVQLLFPVRLIFRLTGDFSQYFRLRELLPITPNTPLYALAVAVLALAGILWLARTWKRQSPAFRVGFLLSLATLTPVLGFMQSAYRLIYLASAGVAMALAGWSFGESARTWRRTLLCLWIAVMSVALVEQAQSWQQAGHVSDRILDKAAEIRRAVPANTATVFVDLPARHYGAYLFTSGFREGLILKTDLAYMEIYDPEHNTFDPRLIPPTARWFRWNGTDFEECDPRQNQH